MTTLMFSGYALGGILARPSSGCSSCPYGWQSVFFVAGAPLLLIPLHLDLPARGRRPPSSGPQDSRPALLARVEPSLPPPPATISVVATGNQERDLGRALFPGRPRPRQPLMFWVAFFSCLLMVYARSALAAKLDGKAG